MLRSLAQITATFATHDGRNEDDAAVLLRTLRVPVTANVIVPTDRAGPGRTAAALFDDEGQARLVIYASLADVGLDLPAIRPVLDGLGRPVHRPRTPGVPHHAHGLAEAVEAAKRGEAGWRLVAEIVRSAEGRTVRAWIDAPDTPTQTPDVRRILASHDAAHGRRIVATLVINLSERLAPLFPPKADD
jgi:hypothetical protein